MQKRDKLSLEDFPPELIERLAARCLELAGIEVPQRLWSEERWKSHAARQESEIRIHQLIQQQHKPSEAI